MLLRLLDRLATLELVLDGVFELVQERPLERGVVPTVLEAFLGAEAARALLLFPFAVL